MKQTNIVTSSKKYSDYHIRIKFVCVCLLAFAVPMIIMGIAFAASEIYPFGNKQVLTIDAFHQYFPFLIELRRKVRAGESLLYCWRLGLGSGFTALTAYYLASPFNLIFILSPEALLKEAFTFMILLKIGFAGVTCVVSLNKTDQKNDYGTVIFSTCYALCSWVLGYYWNIMWLDTFLIFPLVVSGITALVKEKKYKLYTISLSAAIVTNYYIGFMVCIFTAFYFCLQCMIHKKNMKEFIINIRNILLFSILAVMISAAVILPAAVNLRSTFDLNNDPTSWKTMRGWIEVLENTLAYHNPTFREGAPNIYSGVVCIIFVMIFYRLRKISLREKIASAIMIFIFYISMNINMLDYVWHGFHVPNQMPYRYTFMLSFILVVLAYRAYSDIDSLELPDFLFVCATGIGYILLIAAPKIAVFMTGESQSDDEQLWPFLLKNLLIVMIYLGILFLYVKRKFPKNVFTLLLAVAIGVEMIPTAIAAPETVGVTGRDDYPEKYVQVQQMLEEIGQREDESDFYRVELTKRFTFNPSVLYGYHGVSAFTSTANAAVGNMLGKMGVPVQWARLWYYYQNSTPVNNAFLNLKYLISQQSELPNEEYLTEIGKVEDVCAYKNEAYLPIGFMVESTMADFKFDGNTPFENQNQLLKAAAGITEDVFEPLDIVHVAHENVDVTRLDYGTYRYQASEHADQSKEERFVYNYQMPRNGSAYIYMDLGIGGEREASVEFDGRVRKYGIRDANIFPAGTFFSGDIFSVKASQETGTSGDLKIYTAVLNQDVFNKAYEKLSDEVFDVTGSSSRMIKGTITAKKDGLMYTSIPYEPGWKIYVDGKKADNTLIGDAFEGVMLSEGKHTVEFRYSPTHVYLAVSISVLGILLFAGICILDRKKKIRSGI